MKTKNSYVKMVLWMLGGGVVGFLGAIISDIMGIEKMKVVFLNIYDEIIPNIIWVQIGVSLLLIGITIFNYQKATRILKISNEDSEDLIEKVDFIQSLSLIFNSINYILSFILFGLSVDERNKFIIVSIIVFIFSAMFSSFLEVALVKQVKKNDPLKKGDPSKLNFEKEWVESCDEAEKLVIYKSAYKSFTFMKYVLLVGILGTLISKLAFETGNFPIVLIGTIWLLQLLSYSICSIKLQKNKINI